MLTGVQEEVLAEAGLSEGRLVFAPYRACLVGAHSDHQGGTVTGFTLSCGLALGYGPTDDRSIAITSWDRGGTVVVGPGPGQVQGDCCAWAPFVRGAAAMLPAGGSGLRGVAVGSLPAGGLSSSAALSLALLTAIGDVRGAELTHRELAHAAVRIENEFVGVKCGLMDPTVITHGRPDSLVVVDCASNEVTVEPGPSVAILAVYSGMDRALVSTGFNTRTDECYEAARLLAQAAGLEDEPRRLGDLPRELVLEHLEDIPYPYRNRARHFVTEAERVRVAVEAWRAGDLAEFGRCASESFRSSVTNYETGTAELADLTEALQRAPGVYGARFAGGGFGGFCVAVCDPERAEEASEFALTAYRNLRPRRGADAFAVVSRPSAGLARVR